MPITTDTSDAVAKLNALLPRILAGAERGLASIAPAIEESMQTDPAHGDQSGAAHASYVVAGAGGGQDTQGELDFATAVAADKLDGFTGHEGKAAHVDAPTLGEYERGLVLASPVDYAIALAVEGRSPVLPTLQQFAGAMRDAAAQGIKEALA